MKLGKLKFANVGESSSVFEFYEYARYSIVWSMDYVKTFIIEAENSSVLNAIPYIKTDFFYFQLLAVYTAAYWQYLYFSKIVPFDLLTESMLELKRGIDDGIKAITFGEYNIDPVFVQLYNYAFRKYLKGIQDDCSQIHDMNSDVYYPDINNCTKEFIEDAKKFSIQANQVEIDEVKSMMLSNLVADIPLSVFESLSELSVQYISPK